MTRELTEGQRQGYLDAALRAADWFVAGQLCQYRPMAAQGDSRQWRDNDVLPGGGDASVPWTEGKGRMWDANRGRFPYYYFMPGGKHIGTGSTGVVTVTYPVAVGAHDLLLSITGRTGRVTQFSLKGLTVDEVAAGVVGSSPPIVTTR